jgi:hypothetical protein
MNLMAINKKFLPRLLASKINHNLMKINRYFMGLNRFLIGQ